MSTTNFDFERFEYTINVVIESKIIFLFKLLHKKNSPLFQRIIRILEEKAKEYADLESIEMSEDFIEILDILKINMSKIFEDFANSVIPKIYEFSALEITKFFDELRLMPSNPIDTKAVEVLVNETKKIFRNRLNETDRALRYLFRPSSFLSKEAAINEAIAKGLIAKQNIQKAQENLFSVFADEFREGGIITVNGRNYNAQKYIELLARTRLREAQTLATLNESFSRNIYLFRFSKHKDPCKICSPLENKILYAREEDKDLGDYPLEGNKPPKHPNCKHVLIPYIKYPT